MHWALASTLFVMSLTSMSPADASSTPVVVNEVHCQGNDWIELYNTSTTAFDLSGWGVSDKNPNSASLRHRYMFLPKTMIGPKGYLVVEQKGLGSLQLTFGVSCAGGESIRLFKSITSASFETVSEIYVPKIPKKSTYGRLPNGSGAAAGSAQGPRTAARGGSGSGSGGACAAGKRPGNARRKAEAPAGAAALPSRASGRDRKPSSRLEEFVS